MGYREIDDLIGGGEEDEEAERRRLRRERAHAAVVRVNAKPNTPAAKARAEARDRADQIDSNNGDLADIKNGVGVGWLANLYGVARKTVTAKLIGCPVVRRDRNGSPIYDLTVAAGYLSGRKHDVIAALKIAKEEDFPLPMQQRFWKTKILRNKWELDAGQLWGTDDVLETFSETFKAIKNAMMLWVDNVELTATLTKDQRVALLGQVDTLSNRIHETLVEMPKQRRTKSIRDFQMPEIERMMNEVSPAGIEETSFEADDE